MGIVFHSASPFLEPSIAQGRERAKFSVADLTDLMGVLRQVRDCQAITIQYLIDLMDLIK
ncbi:gp06 [Alphaproteobacteria phage PhiJL001]|uniref:Gp06 n=1 Tax=Alphaproteobacteria phage PhiJL001 TaxID=2681607 RepID=Q5DN99_9CAUD|nr:gp06 [Alphaproteobacteria phage PhiJL001]AAT69548.1 gp06 [Alphaproteobacteria phage PhiJL001]